jgi:hypothetical protein
MALDLHIVGRIGEHRCSPLALHQGDVSLRIKGAAAVNPVSSEDPEVSDLAHRHGRADVRQFIGGVLFRFRLRINTKSLRA